MTALIRAEIRKLLSTRVWLFLLLGSTLLGALFSILTLSFAGEPNSGLPARDDPAIQPTVFNPAGSAVVFAVILSIIGITQEFRHRTATPTFLTTPSRGRVVAAKLVVYLVAGLGYAAATAVVLLAIGVPWLRSSGAQVSLAGETGKVLVGGIVATGLYALIGVGVGALVRSQVGAVVGVLVYLFVLEPIVRSIPATAPFYRWLPGGGQEALGGSLQAPDLLERWQGALLLIGYGLVAAGSALALTLRRDIH